MAKRLDKTPGVRSSASGTKRRTATAATRSSRSSPLETMLGYRFADPSLLELALTHRSHPYEARVEATGVPDRLNANGAASPRARETRNTPGTDNEQLEFVGDAVLGLAVTELLYQHFSRQSEGELTRLRASLVSRQRMAALGTELCLGEHLRVGHSAEQNGARHKPALLANAAEAVLAAVYLDAVASGRDGLAEVRKLVKQRLVQPELTALEAALSNDGGRGGLRDAKTILQERVQAEAAGRLRYIDTGQSGPAHQRCFTVEARLEQPGGASVMLGSAEGSSKKEAQQRAAQEALKRWPDRLPHQATQPAQGPASRKENAA